MRWWMPTTATAAALDEGFGGPAAEKLATELLWLGRKMAECGAARQGSNYAVPVEVTTGSVPSAVWCGEAGGAVNPGETCRLS
ncbi:hypothetical protein [Oryza sativa Japonica Group]|uniref:Uncharacterized protein n=1 Tax=Oryza sativa subsp. japonica TaxID=39947 RepID=Q5JNE8_ORYSJ|nr:hypothetical protein [Oryza sativa Japonica Group]